MTRVMEITDGLGARVVFDPVGGPAVEPLTQSMSRGDILLEYGALSSQPTPFLFLFTVIGKHLTLKGYNYREIVNDDVGPSKVIYHQGTCFRAIETPDCACFQD